MLILLPAEAVPAVGEVCRVEGVVYRVEGAADSVAARVPADSAAVEETLAEAISVVEFAPRAVTSVVEEDVMPSVVEVLPASGASLVRHEPRTPLAGEIKVLQTHLVVATEELATLSVAVIEAPETHLVAVTAELETLSVVPT